MLGKFKNNLEDNLFYFLVILILGLARTPFILIPSLHVDVALYQKWTDLLLKLGPTNFYHLSHSDYFPGYLYLLYIIGFLFKNITNLSPLTYQFELFLKFFNGLFDIGTAYIIYLILKNHKQKFAFLGGLIYLLNPVTIFNGLVWGQSDGVVIFFIIASAYLLFELKKYFAWAILFTFAILTKPHAIIITPLLFLADPNKKRFAIYGVVTLVLTVLIASPFFPSNPMFGLVELFKASTNVYPFTSIYADNFWQLFGWFRPDSQIFAFLNLQEWGQILFLAALLVITFPMLNRKTKSARFYLATTLYFMAFFLFLTRIHERYLIFTLPFLLIAAFLNNKRTIAYYAILSAIHFANIWFVYFLLNYTAAANSGSIIFVVLKSKLLSVAALGIFFLLLLELYKTRIPKKA